MPLANLSSSCAQESGYKCAVTETAAMIALDLRMAAVRQEGCRKQAHLPGWRSRSCHLHHLHHLHHRSCRNRRSCCPHSGRLACVSDSLLAFALASSWAAFASFSHAFFASLWTHPCHRTCCATYQRRRNSYHARGTARARACRPLPASKC